MLESVLCKEYKPLISENALICLYGLRRASSIRDEEEDLIEKDDQNNKVLVKRKVMRISLPSNIKMSGAQLDEAVLEGAILAGADFSGADLSEAILTNVSFVGANLRKANLSGAEMGGSQLNACNLESAVLESANLEGADLTNAKLGQINIRGANLLNSKGLDLEVAGAAFSDELHQEEQLFDRKISLYWDRVEKTYFRLLGITRIVVGRYDPVDDAEGLLLDVIISMATRIHNLDLEEMNEEQFLRYMSLVVRNRSIDRIRKLSHRNEISLSVLPDIADNSSAEETLEMAELEQRLSIALETLSDEAKSMVKDRYFLGMTNRDIAEKHGMSRYAVQRRIRSALRVLESKLSGFV